MSTPNPLIPQGTFQAQAARGASNVRLAVATIVAIHVVFFGGLLLQGCKRDTQTTQNTQTTNAEPSTNLALPTLDSSSLYYSSSSNLPTDAGARLSAVRQRAQTLSQRKLPPPLRSPSGNPQIFLHPFLQAAKQAAHMRLAQRRSTPWFAVTVSRESRAGTGPQSVRCARPIRTLILCGSNLVTN